MPLAHQRQELPFFAGIDTKTNRKAVQPPGLLTLQNVDMSETGRIKKRRGYSALDVVASAPAGPPTDIEQIDVLGDRAIVWGDNGLFERFDSGDAWAKKVISQQSAIASTELRRFAGDIVDAATIGGAEDYAQTNGYEVLAYMTSATAGVLLFIEQSTGTVIRRTPVTGVERDIKVAAVANTLLAVYTDTTNIRVYRFDTTTPTTAPILSTPYTDVPASAILKKFDIAPSSTHLIVAYSVLVGGPGPGIKFAQITTGGAAGSSAIYPATSLVGSGEPREAIGLAVAANDDMVAAWGDSVRIEVAGVDSTFSLVADHVLDGTAGAGVENIVVSVRDATNASVYYEELGGGGVFNQSITDGDILITGGAGSGIGATIFGFGLAHKPLVITTGAQDNTYLGVVREADIESIYITFQFGPGGQVTSENIVAKYAHQTAAGLRVSSHVSAFVSNGLGGYGWALGTKFNIFLDSTGSQNFAIALQRAYFALQKTSSEVINGMLHRAGSSSVVYGEAGVGGRPGDINFAYGPELTALTAGIGGSLTRTATYTYRAVYEYEDEHGNIHRSAPSEPLTVSLAGSQDQVTVGCRTLAHSQSSRTTIALYRNVAGQTVLHRTEVTFAPGVTANGAGAASATDTNSDVAISTAQILYTESGALPNAAPPPTDVLVEHKNRLWAIDKDTGNIWFSKEVIQGEGVAFTAANQIAADSPSERPLALVSMDTALAVFWRKRVGLIYGDGPNDAGVGGSFTTPQIVEGSPVGCSDQASIVKTPRGVFFKDADIGYHVLPLGGGVPQYIGAPVEDFNTLTIVDASVMEDREEIRFTATSGTVLIYHYNVGFWSTSILAGLGGESITDAAIWLGTHLVGTDGAALHHEQDDIFLDDSAYVSTVIETGWIKFEGFQGGARVWDVFLLGSQLDDHIFSVTMEYDYGSSPSDLFRVNDGTFAASVDPHELRFHMIRQSIKSLKLRIEDEQAAAPTTNEGFGLTNLRLLFGIEPKGRPRVGASNYIPPVVPA